MNSKLLKNLMVVAICLVCAFVYSQITNDKKSTETKESETKPTNFQTIVLKDKNDTLVPIEVNMQVTGESDQVFRNMLYLMQSNDYESLGLYPLFSDTLEVNAMQIEDKVLTFDFNDSLYASSNEDALDMLEGLSYTFCSEDIEQIKLKINGEEIQYIPNSTIPVSCLTSALGINNFECDSLNIHKTVPVIVYNHQIIENKDYYVPTTTRLEVEQQDFNSQVSLLLKKINYVESVSLEEEVSFNDGNIQVSLSSNILLGNETIDETLYQQLLLSIGSLEGVKEVQIFVDGEEMVPTIDVSEQINNRIKL